MNIIELMLNINQLNSLKDIYQLFSNLSDNVTQLINKNAIIWLDEININDDEYIHIEKLNTIMKIISHDQLIESLKGNLDDIIIIVFNTLIQRIYC